jgi:hypothetical protein
MVEHVTRRDFVKAGALTAAGAALGWTPTYTVYAGNPTKEKTAGILNYNEQMEYRRGGKTNVMFSAVCLGGHWKRVNTVLPDAFKVQGAWGSVSLDNTGFQKNRHDVVTRCIECISGVRAHLVISERPTQLVDQTEKAFAGGLDPKVVKVTATESRIGTTGILLGSLRSSPGSQRPFEPPNRLAVSMKRGESLRPAPRW